MPDNESRHVFQRDIQFDERTEKVNNDFFSPAQRNSFSMAAAKKFKPFLARKLKGNAHFWA